MVFKSILTALCSVVMISLPFAAWAESRVDDILQQLAAAPDDAAANRLEDQLMAEWSKSGSAAMDLLLKRGQDALEVQQTGAALDHFRALTDHAPEFAEGWYGLALANFQSDRLGVAMDALERTLALNPYHMGAMRGVGAIQDRVGKAGLAYEAYGRVLDLRPKDDLVIEARKRLERDALGVSL